MRSCVVCATLASGIAFASACHDGAPPSANSGVSAPAASNSASPPDATEAGATNAVGAAVAATDAAPDVAHDAASGTPTDVGSDGGTGRVVVHVDDDGKSFDLTVGSHIVFALANHSGTGFVWMPTRVDESLLSPDGMRRSEIESDVPGAPKRDVLRYVAKKVGTTVVEMTLKRPFGTAPPGPAIHVTVHVR